MLKINYTAVILVIICSFAGCAGGGASGGIPYEGEWTEDRNNLDRRITGFLEDDLYDEAAALIDSIITSGYEDSRLLAQKGYALGMTGRGGEAIPLFEESILADYENCWYHHSFAVVLMKMNRVGRALTEFREARRFCAGRELVQVYRDLAVAHIKLGDEQKAYQAVRDGLERDPSDSYLLGLNTLLEVRKDPLQAGELVPRLLEMEGLDPDLCERIADVLLENGRPQLAAELLSKALNDSGATSELVLKLAVALKNSGRQKEAREVLLEEGGENPSKRTRKLLADILFEEREFKKALDIYLSLSKTAEVLDRTAMTYRELGELDEALRYGKMALEIRPDWITGKINLAVIYGSRGELDEALTILEGVLKIDPDNEAARENIRRIKDAINSAE